MTDEQEHTRFILQRIMQVLGPVATCECAGCAWETNEVIRLLNELGITYQTWPRIRSTHRSDLERLGNATSRISGWRRFWGAASASLHDGVIASAEFAASAALFFLVGSVISALVRVAWEMLRQVLPWIR